MAATPATLEALIAQTAELFPVTVANAQAQFEAEVKIDPTKTPSRLSAAVAFQVKAKIAEGTALTETGENAAIKAAMLAARVNLGVQLLIFESPPEILIRL